MKFCTANIKTIISLSEIQLPDLGGNNGYVQESRRYNKPTLKSAEHGLYLKRAESKKLPLITLNCSLITKKST